MGSAGSGAEFPLLQTTAEGDTFFWRYDVQSIQRIRGVLLSMRSTNLI